MSNISLVEESIKKVILFPLIAFFLSIIVLISLIADLIKKHFLKIKVIPHGKAVFITGCDSGFGNLLAKRLDSKGFTVFAACLFPTGAGATELKASCSDRLHVLHMDVTKDESVEKALEYVKENLGSSKLWAIVNNAGIMKALSLELSSVADFRDCFEVNFLGYVKVIKAFLPLLKQIKGRIINVTSGAGEIPLPFTTPYTASKYAATGFTDCIRSELDMSEISVVSIEPEIFLTGLTSPDTIRKNFDDKIKGLDTELTEEYGYDYPASLTDATQAFLSFASPKLSNVVDDMESAVSLVHPYHTYKPRRHLLSRFICFYFRIMPRSSQILITKMFFFVFFSESKTIKNIVMKGISFI